MEHAHWWGQHLHWFWIMPFIFVVLMFVFATFMAWRGRYGCCGVGRIGRGPFAWGNAGQHPMAHWWSGTARQTLDLRYANGEITKEQYEQMTRDIESVPLRPGSGDR